MNDRIADAAASIPAAATVGLSILDVNPFLQAGAFIVAMISGICAARYYWKKAGK